MVLGLGAPELVVILAVALVLFGPKNLPKLGSAVGKTVKNFREGMETDEAEPVAEKPAKATANKAQATAAAAPVEEVIGDPDDEDADASEAE